MKLKNKINLATSVLFICLLILVNISIFMIFSKMMLNAELERTSAEANQAFSGISTVDETIPMQEILPAYVPVHGMIQIVKAEGKVDSAVTGPEQKQLREELPVNFYQKEVQTITEHNGIPHAFVVIPMISRNGDVVELQVVESLEATDKMLDTLRLVLVAVTILAMIPVLVSSSLLSNFITRPITSLIKTMREIAESGQFKQIPLAKESKDELYQMGETFNKMIELLEVNYDRQGQFISNASHELKTPITVIESYASLLKRRGKNQPELFDESVEAIHSEALRMKELTEQLLQLAKHDGKWMLEMETMRIHEVVDESIRAFQKAYHREVDFIVEDEAVVNADLQMFKQLFYILIDNARKYSEEKVVVRVGKTGEHGIVEVIDHGIGIPAEDLDKIFDRFYRVDKARSRKTGGFGLGLPLAKDIAQAMGAQFTIESIEGLGTTAKISLPLADSH